MAPSVRVSCHVIEANSAHCRDRWTGSCGREIYSTRFAANCKKIHLSAADMSVKRQNLGPWPPVRTDSSETGSCARGSQFPRSHHRLTGSHISLHAGCERRQMRIVANSEPPDRQLSEHTLQHSPHHHREARRHGIPMAHHLDYIQLTWYVSIGLGAFKMLSHFTIKMIAIFARDEFSARAFEVLKISSLGNAARILHERVNQKTSVQNHDVLDAAHHRSASRSASAEES
jgi:hypothetical protein